MKKVLIIGASSGIGKELALAYAKQGCHVTITARRLEKLKEISLQHKNIHYDHLDITDFSQSEKLALLVKDTDITIISAGIGELNPALQWETELSTLNTNVCGFAFAANVVFNYYKTCKKGHIVAISSLASLRGSDIAPAYNASKAFVSNYMDGLRKKAHKENLNICLSTVLPGLVDTQMAKGEGLFWVESPEKIAREIMAGISKKKSVFVVSKKWNLIRLLLQILPDKWYYKF